MGSSKKHKSEKKKKKSRSPEKSKERHRHHKKHHRDRKRKAEVIETEIISSDTEVEEIIIPPPPKITRVEDRSYTPPPPPQISSATTDSKSHESLSIDDTNKLRAKLGLKPLKVDSAPKTESEDVSIKKDTMGGTDMGDFVHKPATNIAEKVNTEKIKQKLAERKMRRELEAKLKKTKTLGSYDEEEDDIQAWVEKSRLRDIERKQAEKRAKMLEELDNEFGVASLIEEETREVRRDAYTAKHLRGLKVQHGVSAFSEGKQVILTLKDSDVLYEDGDVLVNVNMLDDERYKKNIDNKKLKPGTFGYDVYDDSADPLASRDVLAKYNEEIDGVQNDSFTLGEEDEDIRRAKQRDAVRGKLMKNRTLVSLNTGPLTLASEYYTQDEIDSKFKKPTKKVRKIRKKPKMLKAEDLLPLEEQTDRRSDIKVETARNSSDVVKDEPMDEDMNLDELNVPTPDLSDVKLEPDEGELELQLALSKARKLKQREKTETRTTVDKVAKEIISQQPRYKEEGPGGSIVLNSTAEFCRTLGDIPTYGLSGNREEDEQELLDFEREMKEEKKRSDEEKKNRGAWNQVDVDDVAVEVMKKEAPILDAEPNVGSGVAGALRLAVSKGYLEKETTNRPSASRFAHLQAQNYSIDDKAHGEDDKFGRRERYVGPTTDFKEKDNYKPNVKLDYIDDDGHLLSSKEAFRYLSHKFHGKGPGKNKVEKRMKKQEQEGLMKQMSSTDTPLRTLTMLQHKQKETQSPYVVLSGNKQVQSANIIRKH